jgi:hypothetical protein
VTLELFPYQRDGAAFLASRERACLFDEMGTGKSAQAIRALDDVGAKRIIIICPAAVREVWVGELRKFARIPRKILKGRDIQDLKLWLVGRADVLILSYEMATTWAKRMEGDLIDAVVFDEAHYLKSPDALRTRALLSHDCDGKRGLARWGARVWFMTGTPNPNDAADLWSMLRFTGATRLTRKTFRDRYYKTRFGDPLGVAAPHQEGCRSAAPADLVHHPHRRRRRLRHPRDAGGTPWPRGRHRPGRQRRRAVVPRRPAHLDPAPPRRRGQGAGLHRAPEGGTAQWPRPSGGVRYPPTGA